MSVSPLKSKPRQAAKGRKKGRDREVAVEVEVEVEVKVIACPGSGSRLGN